MKDVLVYHKFSLQRMTVGENLYWMSNNDIPRSIHSFLSMKVLINISEVTNFVAVTWKLWKIIYQSYETYLSVRMEASRNLTWKKCKNFRIILSLQDLRNKLMSSIQNNKVCIKKTSFVQRVVNEIVVHKAEAYVQDKILLPMRSLFTRLRPMSKKNFYCPIYWIPFAMSWLGAHL